MTFQTVSAIIKFFLLPPTGYYNIMIGRNILKDKQMTKFFDSFWILGDESVIAETNRKQTIAARAVEPPSVS